MDAFQQQQQSPHHQRFMRPPQPPPPSTPDPHQPPSTPDPHHYYNYHQQQPPPPPGGGGGGVQSWYPNQIHYHSPPPPPPQWAPPQQHQPYPTHPPQPPPRPLMPQQPQIPQPYPNNNIQEWGNQNWSHHQQSWDYGAAPGSNSEDWAARAREWAAAKTALGDQNSQTQFLPPEGQSQFHDQYQQANGSHYPSGYQQYPPPPPPVAPPQMVYSQETAAFSSGHLPYPAGDGPFPGVSSNGFSTNGTLPGTHQQEVPSSYSSVTGKEETVQKEIYTSLPFSTSSAQGGQYPTADLGNQPLDFTPQFNHGPLMQSSYATTAMYPPAPPLGPQHDPSMGVPPFVNFPGSTFQPTLPSAGTPFGLGHHSTAFPVDTYGISNISERQKKAAMPNWLKEEIIKNKAVISKSSLEHPKEEMHSVEDDGFDRSIGKEDPVDSRSVDSPKSTEDDDDDDEDYVEAARTAAINQEIKRVLTEVLLKVTDDLFDEIATRVLKEDDMAVEASALTNESAKVLITNKANGTESGGNSSSSSPGDVLGLGNYVSDEEDDGGGSAIQSSRLPNSIEKVPEHVHDAIENGHSQVKPEKNDKSVANDKGVANLESNENRGADVDVTVQLPDGKIDQVPNDTSAQKITVKPELLAENVDLKSPKEDSQSHETKAIDKHDQYESGRSTSAKKLDKEVENNRHLVDENENRRRKDENHCKKEKTDDQSGSKDRINESESRKRSSHHDIKEKEKTDDRSGSKDRINESESRKRSSHHDIKEGRKDREKHHKERDRKREREKEKEEEKSRHKLTSDSSRHKKRRSPSVSSRDYNNKENNSSDEVSDDSKRKRRSKKRNLSPSPVRSRRRQVSRSPPHSKHSQRRHSPYSSLENSRRRRSRSRSPARRHR